MSDTSGALYSIPPSYINSGEADEFRRVQSEYNSYGKRRSPFLIDDVVDNIFRYKFDEDVKHLQQAKTSLDKLIKLKGGLG